MTTPTPGDLSARHVEVLREMFAAAANERRMKEADALAYAIAALSALPAAGGGDVLDAVMNEALRNGTGIMRIDPASIYTTPQPSAADDYESWAKQERQREDTATRLGSAAVGAQGDGDDRALIDAAIKMLRADGFVRSADAIRRLATPAAGKGVDDVPEYMRGYNDGREGIYRPVTNRPRQPVAGDGMGAGEREELERLRSLVNTPELHDFTCGVVLEGAHQRERWGNDHDAGKEPQDWFWLVGYLAGKALRSHLDGNTDKALHHTITVAAACANWHGAILGTHNMRPGIDGEAALAAPAATPTAGGEGNNV